MASLVSEFTPHSVFVKDSRGKAPQAAPANPANETFRTSDRSLAALLIVTKHALPFCGVELGDNGGVVFIFEDVRHEGVRLYERWAQARRPLRRAARAARQQGGNGQRHHGV